MEALSMSRCGLGEEDSFATQAVHGADPRPASGAASASRGGGAGVVPSSCERKMPLRLKLKSRPGWEAEEEEGTPGPAGGLLLLSPARTTRASLKRQRLSPLQ